ncbi:universal stress protein [Pseudacidobacterium ailaaui]|jgi:nucleotide-binding universal stress UspA family protein|uniref:universal stress protein n=1 Tax=Pseudacidobacterium ailaaui TaxID=1382359 RepID=UPI0009DD5397|nr:universal stress protein [Pseudacidobacterium ailaaui]
MLPARIPYRKVNVVPSQTASICIPPSRVLLATDLADLTHILPVAIAHALKCNAELKLVHVLPDVNTPDVDPTLLVCANPEVVRHYAETVLENAAKEARSAGVNCGWIARPGLIVPTIREIVQEWNPDRFLVGSQGPHKFQLGILGSVAEAIFREIDVPVLAIGPEFQHNPHSASQRARILFATALDRASRTTIRSVIEFAKAHNANLTLLHVMPMVTKAHPSTSRARAYAERFFQEILGEIGEKGLRPTCMIEFGPVVETIHRVAKSGRFDLIVLGAVSGAAFRREIMPGTAYGVLCGAPCPVMVLKDASERRLIPVAS